MVLNADNCHFMCIGKDTKNERFIFNDSNEQKIFGITIDIKLTFKSHIKILCKKSCLENSGFFKAIKSCK